jgi:hypothetical protein
MSAGAPDDGDASLTSPEPITAIEAACHPELKALRQAVGKVVGSVFYQTLLKSMRESPLRSEVGHGGYGERVFERRLDAELAARAGVASRNRLAVAMLERLADQQLRMQRCEGEGSASEQVSDPAEGHALDVAPGEEWRPHVTEVPST